MTNRFAADPALASAAGLRSVAVRGVAGDTQWGRQLLRHRGAIAQLRSYPALLKIWRQAGLVAAGLLDASAVEIIPGVSPDIMNPYSVKMREKKEALRRVAQYDALQMSVDELSRTVVESDDKHLRVACRMRLIKMGLPFPLTKKQQARRKKKG